MQQQVTFYIDFINGDGDTLISTIKEIVSEYSFETPVLTIKYCFRIFFQILALNCLK